MSTIRSRVARCGFALTVAACTHGAQRPAGPGAVRGSGAPGAAALPTPVGQPASASSTPNASLKRVARKEEPATLFAADRSSCTVTANRFRKTDVGDTVLCDWRAGDRQP